MKKRTVTKILTLLITFSMIFTLFPVNIKNVHAQNSKVNIGDYIYLGTYQGEEIKWRCIGEDSNGKLMLSDKILCRKSYDAKYSEYKESHRRGNGTNRWSESALRHWMNSAGEVDWSNRSIPSAGNVEVGEPYDEEQGFLSSFTDSELRCVKTTTQKTYLNNLDASEADGGSSKFDFNANGEHRELFETLADATDKWYENTTDQFFLIGPEQLLMGTNNIGLDYMDPDDAYWLRLPCNTGQSYENVARSVQANRISYARANNSNQGVRAAFYLNEDQYDGEVIEGGMSTYFETGKDTNQFKHKAMRAFISNPVYLNKLVKQCNDFQSKWRMIKYFHGEYTGVCHGIALSMCYGNQGYIDFDDITSGAYDYWTMGSPYVNSKMKDMIFYYHLTQCLDSGSATYGISKDVGWGNGDLETFLKKFVAEAQYAKNVKKPFVFSFKVPEGGHSVVVCGYKKDTDGNHEITIYDENSYHPGSFGGYLTMKVSSDFKRFHFADSNSRFDDVCVEDLWTNLSYYGVDKIYNGGIQILKTKNKTAASMNIATLTNTTTSAYTVTSTDQEDDLNKTTIQISANKRFRLQNEEGKYLEYDGENYTGDMKVYSCDLSDTESDHPIWNLRVDVSNSFELTNAEEGCQLLCDDKNKGYAVTADGADKVTIASGKIKVEGDNYNLSAAMQSKNSDEGIVQIDAEIQGNSTILDNSTNTSIQFDDKGNDVKVTKYVDFSVDTVDEKEEVTGSDFVVEELDKKDPETPDQGDDNKGNDLDDNTGNGAGNDISGNNGQNKPEATTQTRQPSTEKSSKLKTQTIKTAKIKTYKAKNLKRKKVTFNLKARSLGKAKLTYKVAGYPKKAKKYITVTKNGKVTLKKKAKKGTYKIQITAQKTSQYQKAVKYVTVKVK